MYLRRPDRSLDFAPASIGDYRELARRTLPRQLFDYIDGGAFGEVTLRANREDLSQIQLRQRVLRDVSRRNLTTSVLGQEISMPVILAPVGFAGMFSRRGEVSAARSAERAGVPFCESTLSICDVQEVNGAVSKPAWFQLYVMKDRSYADALMEKAWDSGSRTLVLTVDLPVVGQRYRDVRNGISGETTRSIRLRRGLDIARHPRWVSDVALRGKPLTFGNLQSVLPLAKVPADFQRWIASQFDPSVTWEDLTWIREKWKGTLAVKGVLDADDARQAVARGADAVIVSNHGGRQLDDVPSTIRVLPEIAAAVGDECDVLMDGGIRSGLDVVKALSLGAKACLLGRAWVYALAGGGERGVDHMFQILRTEMLVTLGLTGVSDVKDLDASILYGGDAL